MSESKTTTISFPFISILTVIFVVGKLMGSIAWSWWWVFSPLWISFIGFFAILVFLGLLAVIAALLK